MRNILRIVLFFVLIFLPSASGANAATTFNFPSCEARLGQTGDKAHYSSGLHQILGGGLVEGRDDVFSLSDGNFLQCFCPASGNTGIQTNWLRTDDPVSGWQSVNGSQWNLGNFNYAAQNINFNCQPAPVSAVSAPQPCLGCGGVTTPVCDSAKPLPPTNFTVTRTGSTARLTWTESANTTHYSLLYGLKPGDYIYGVVNTGKTTSFTVGSLDPGQKYYFAIKSVNNCMPSDPATTGQVLGASTIAGLAATGNTLTLVSLYTISIITFIMFMIVSTKISFSENYEKVKSLTFTLSLNFSGVLLPGQSVSISQILQSRKAYAFGSSTSGANSRNPAVYRHSTGPPVYPGA